MRSEASEVRFRGGRQRPLAQARRGAARNSVLRRIALEALEPRTLLATSALPTPTVPTNPVDISNPNLANDGSNESSPSIAIDPNNPLDMVSVWTQLNPNLGAANPVRVQAAVSTDGGQTWANQFTVGGTLLNPATTNPEVPFLQVTDASVGFDRNDNFYVLDSQHTADNTTGALVLNSFSFAGGAHTALVQNKVIYEWSGADSAYTPMMAVDDNVSMFSDVNSSGVTETQNDPNSGNVYVAWATNDTNTTPNGIPNFNPNRIVLVTSSDGGQDFSGYSVLNNSGNSGTARNTLPQLAISQGAAPRAARTNGPNDPGSPGVTPGQVTVVWDDFGSEATASPARDVIWANTVTGTNVVQTFSGSGGVITDAATGNIPATTNFPIAVNIPANSNFSTLSDLTVTIPINHPALNELSLVLIPPPGSLLPSGQPMPAITLAQENTGANIGLSGANLGILNGIPIGTTFDQNATRSISGGSGAAAPYFGHFRPEVGSLAVYNGATAAELNGQWTLQITDFKNGNVGTVNSEGWSMTFTSGMNVGTNTVVTTTSVRGNLNGTGQLVSAAAPTGIGPGLSLASDNTLGAYSPYQGRLYLAYVDRAVFVNGNPSDNTDIFLLTSDDGGQSWQPPAGFAAADPYTFSDGQMVNDDNAVTDGFSESDPNFQGRAQFQPQVAVDPLTGTVAMSWYDGRNDAARARVATYVTASIDGGQTFATQVFANQPETAVDAITGQTVTLGPVPDNESSGNASRETTFGFGTHQGLAISGGQIHTIWSSNLNGGFTTTTALLDIRTNTIDVPGGPRVISSTMGAVGLPGDTINPTTAADGTPIVSAFQVTFDRPVDPSTFGSNQVQVFYHDLTPGNVSGGLVPVTSVVPLYPDPNGTLYPGQTVKLSPSGTPTPFGATTFMVHFAPRSAVGTYSYTIGPNVADRIRNTTFQITPSGATRRFTATDTPLPVPPSQSVSTTTSSIAVSGFAANRVVDNVTVTVNNLTYPVDTDLILTLIAPDGTRVLLSNQHGTNFGVVGANYTGTTFSDAGTTAIGRGFAPFPGTFRPEAPLSQLNGHAINGTWQLEVDDVGTGTNTGSLKSWSLSLTGGTVSSSFSTGNQMDQNASSANRNASGLEGLGIGLHEAAVSGVGIGDVYAVPTPTSTGSSFQFSSGQFFPGPYSQATLPLVVPGPHVVSTNIAGNPVGSGMLQVDGTVSAIDVTFDRDMQPGTFTPADVLRIMGPMGLVTAPQTFSSTNIGQTIPDNPATPLVSTLTIPDNNNTFPIANLAVNLSIASTRDGDLTVTLIGPDNTQINLVAQSGGAGQNFIGTTFSDQGTTPIALGSAPFTGTFVPAQPLGTFNGKQLQGTWHLKITDNVKNGSVSTLTNWSLVATPAVTVTELSPRTYQIGFPQQVLSGTYTVQLGSSILSAGGDALDTNLNAGVDLLRGTPSSTTGAVTYTSANVPQTLPVGTTVPSTLTVPANFIVENPTLTLNISEPYDPGLTATLLGPDGSTSIVLFSNVGAFGTEANFQGTVFDDSASTLISSGGPPFFGRFEPQQPLSAFNGTNAGGTWQLILSTANGAPAQAGTLNSWSITFPTSVPISGLGEPVADQFSTSFQIFQMDPTNRLSSNTWTAVGPTSVGTGPVSGATNGYAGSVTAIAVDPSDPSGNTVYIGAASGGIWKTTDFLTTDPAGPTYIPLTDFGPSFGMNIGSIAVFPRNNDPNQSIIIAGTGNGSASLTSIGSNTSQGVGFLRSMDGGATWTLLDSTTNVDATGNELPISSPSRDHVFSESGGTTTFKVVVDPHATPTNGVIIYAAMGGPNGGLWRSLDTGNHWQKMSTSTQGNVATDVVLDLNSATVDAVSNPTGNVNFLYASFASSGVFFSPNRGVRLDSITGNNFDAMIRDAGVAGEPAITVNNGTQALSGARIALALPTPLPSTAAGADVENLLHEGWLYAAVTRSGRLVGLFMTKDYGQTWTQIKLSTVPSVNNAAAQPSNNPNNPNFDPVGSAAWPNADYELALTVDPNNPNIVYLGGTEDGNGSGLIRVNTTATFDSHASVAYDGSRPDGGLTQINTLGRIAVKNLNNGIPLVETSAGFTATQYLNLIQDPTQPFESDSTVYVYNNASFTNDGSGTTWIPFDQVLNANANDPSSSTNLHQAIAMVDPLTGATRLIFADDQGVFTGVDQGNGTLDPGIGTQAAPTYSRNGNLQVAQFFYGAAQPSSAAAQIAQALFYGNGNNLGSTSSDPNILTNGDLAGNSSVGSGFITGDDYGTAIATDQQGQGIVYQFVYPGSGALTNFFQVSVDGGPFISRTQGLIQSGNAVDPQWPTVLANLGNGIRPSNFTVNPLDGNQVIISSSAGRVFGTINQGKTWQVLANPGDLDGSYVDALTYGAPDPNGPNSGANLNDFIYVGTIGGGSSSSGGNSGHIFVTQTGGGALPGGGNSWTSISTGLDGSPVVEIIANPTRGSHEAYAVTQKGVYHTFNSLAPATAQNPTWTNITGNLFGLTAASFNDPNLVSTTLQYLTTIQADWRYVIPTDPTKPVSATNPTHPLLYVAGEGGVYRSLDDGVTWTPYPNIALDGSVQDGGLLPNVHVTDLSMSLGNIATTTGRATTLPNDPNTLLATTFGRGQFAIRLAPLVLPNAIVGGVSNDLLGVDPADDTGQFNNDDVTRSAAPHIDGLSEQSAFGNTVTIALFNLADPNNPVPIPTIGNTQTDGNGHFSVQIAPGYITADGSYTIGVQATDVTGAKGNIAPLTIIVDRTPPVASAAPALEAASDSGLSNSDDITNVNTAPVFDVAGNEVGSTVTLERAPLAFASGLGATVIPVNGVLTSTIAVPAAALSNPAATITALTLNLAQLNVGAGATVTLTAPDGTTVVSVNPPFIGNINLSAQFTGLAAAGTYTLTITNSAATAGSLSGWSMSLTDSGGTAVNSATTQPAYYANPGGTLASTVTIPAASLVNAGETIPGLVLDLSKLVVSKLNTPQAGDLTLTLTLPDNSTINIPASAAGTLYPLSPSVLTTPAAGTYTLTIANAATAKNIVSLGGWSVELAGVNTASSTIPANGAVASQITIPASSLNTAIPANGTFTATVLVPSTSLSSPIATVSSLSLDLSNLNFPTTSDLTVTLTSPDGTVIPVNGPYTATTPVAIPGGTLAEGAYTLTIVNAGANTGTLPQWTLNLTDSGARIVAVTGPSIADGVTLDLSQLNFPAANLGNLTITLKGPDGTIIPVPSPYTGSIDLAGLNGLLAAGTYTLSITNTGTSTGTLPSWSLALPGTMTAVTAVNSLGAPLTGTAPLTVSVADTNAGNGAIPDGVYVYTAMQTDLAGNPGPVGAGLTVEIDTTAPLAAPPGLTHGTDSGLPVIPRNSDDITNVPLPSFEGYVEPNATVTLFVNGANAGTMQADATGYYQIATTVSLVQGLNNITVQETDIAGNAGGSSQALVVQLDTTPPPPVTVTLSPASDTGFSNTDHITFDSTPTFTGTAEKEAPIYPLLVNPTPLTGGALVQIYAQVAVPAGQMDNNPTILVGEALADPVTGAFSVTVGQYVNPQPPGAVTALADNSYNITAIQYDVAGNPSQALTFGNTGAIVIDGTDSPLHGDNSGPGGANELGWLYMEKVFNLIQPNITNGEKTLVVLGGDPSISGATNLTVSALTSVFAQSILPGLGWTMVFVTGAANMNTYLSGLPAQAVDFTDAPAGTVTLAQTGFLDLPTEHKLVGDITDAELAVINTHGTDIKNYVNTGGGLYAETELPSTPGVVAFGWLQSIFPGLQPVAGTGSGTGAVVTPQGQLIFPTASAADFQSAVWHNYFTGNFGSLATVVLAPLNAGGGGGGGGGGALEPIVLASTGGSAAATSSQITIDTDGPDPKPVSPPVLEAGSDTGVSNSDGITQDNNSLNNNGLYQAPIFDVANVEGGAEVQLYRAPVVGGVVGTPVLVNIVFNASAASATISLADINQSDTTQLPTPSNQNFVAIPGPAIPDGTYVYTAVLTDIAGVPDAPSAGTTVVIDATAPVQPTGFILDPGSDTGRFNNDNITKDNNGPNGTYPAPIFDVSSIAAGNTVQLLRNGVVVDTLTNQPAGTIQIADTNNGNGVIPDGTYIYTVQQTDLAGNTSVKSQSQTAIIDSDGPDPKPVSPPVLEAGSDTGVSTSDGITQDNNSTQFSAPIFDVATVEAGATVQLYRQQINPTTGNPIDPQPVLVRTVYQGATSGTVSLADINNGAVGATSGPVIPDGTYLYTVQLTDLAGVTDAASASTKVTILSTAPTQPSPFQLDPASDTGRSSNDNITRITVVHAPTFDVGSTTPGAFGNVLAGATVNLYRENPGSNVFKLVGSQVSANGGFVMIQDTTAPIPDGTYIYRIQQVDIAGNPSSIGGDISVTYITVAPPAPSVPALDPNSTTGPPGSNATSDTAPFFDVSNVQPHATLTLLRNGNKVNAITDVGATGGTISIQDNSGTVTYGTYSYTAFQTDVAGNTSPIGPAVQVTFRVDVPGAISLDSSTDSGTKGDHITNVTTNLKFDVAGITAGATVKLLRGNVAVNTITNSSGGNIQIVDPSTLTQGQYVYSVQQIVNGTPSPAGPTLTITVDTTLPSAPSQLKLDLSTDSGALGDNLTNFTAPVIDVVGVGAGSTVLLFRNNVQVASVLSQTGGTVMVTDNTSPIGPNATQTFQYTARQVDAASNTSGLSSVLALTIDTTVPAAPGLALDPASNTGTPGQNVTSSTSPTIDITGVVAKATVSLYRGTTLIKSVLSSLGGTVKITDPGPLTNGQYTYTATQVSAAGTSSATSQTIITVNTSQQSLPTIPTVALAPASDTGIPGDGITSNHQPTFTGIANPPGVTVSLTNVATGKVVGTAASDSQGNFSITLSASLVDGSYTFTAQSKDASNNLSPVSDPVSVSITSVPGDYSGSGKTSPVVFLRVGPYQLQWLDPGVFSASFGSGTTDVPIVGDFNGDGKADLAVYRPSTGYWYVNLSSTPGVTTKFAYGEANVDIPVVGNFFGTGASVVAVYRPPTGTWYIAGVPIQFGGPMDQPVPGDYAGVGSDQIAVYRVGSTAPGQSWQSEWYILSPNGKSQTKVAFGGPGDVPVPGGYDNSATRHVTEEAVFDPSTGTYYIIGPSGVHTVQFAKGDIPAPGDYDGVGYTEAAVYRPSTGQFFVESPIGSAPRVVASVPGFQAADIPAMAPYSYRALGTSASSVNLGAMASSFSASSVPASTSPTVSAAAVATPTSTPVSNTPAPAPTRSLPKQAVSHPRLQLHAAMVAAARSSLRRLAGRHLPGSPKV